VRGMRASVRRAMRRRGRERLHCMGIAVLVLLVPRPSAAQEYHVDRDAENVVRFLSDATIDDFEGVTDRIDGFVRLGGAGGSGEAGSGLAVGATAGSDFYLEVDLASLDTGIRLRNRHMRDNYLETGRFPYASFAGSFARVSAAPGGGFTVVGGGELSIHGVNRAANIVCAVDPSGTGYRARCSFAVLLSDYDIDIPKVMFMKLANEIRVELDFLVVPAPVEGGVR